MCEAINAKIVFGDLTTVRGFAFIYSDIVIQTTPTNTSRLRYTLNQFAK